MLRASAGFPILALVALAALFLRRGLSGDPDAVLGRVDWDMDVLFYPQKQFAVRSILAGDFPLWNPHLFCGMPFHATLHPALLYPPNLLFLVLPLAPAFNVLFALHLALAGIFTYALLRELRASAWAALFGAIAFAFSSRLLLHVHVGQFPQVEALAWTPGLFFFAVRVARAPSAKRVVALSVAVACALLAGFPQYPVYAVVALSIGAAAHCLLGSPRRVAALALVAAAVAGGVLLAAAQLLPALEYARDSFRSQAPFKFTANGYLPFENLATLVLPAALGDGVHAWYFGKWSHAEMIYYAGVATVAFAAFGVVSGDGRRRCAPWFLLFVGAVVLALGVQTPVFELVRRVPVLQKFRGIGKFAAVGLLGLSVCAGLGLDSFLARANAPRDLSAPCPSRLGARCARARALLVILAALAALGLAILAAVQGEAGSRRVAALCESVAPAEDEHRWKPPPSVGAFHREVKDALASNAGRLVACAVCLSAAALFACRAIAALATLLLALDLFTAFDPFLRTIPVAGEILPSPKVARAMSDVPPLARFGGPREWMLEGVSQGASAVGGWEGNIPLRTLAFMNLLADRAPKTPSLWYEPSRLSPLVDLLVMQRLLRPKVSPMDSARFRLIGRDDDVAVYDRVVDLPRAYVVHQVEFAPDLPAAWRSIRDGALDPYRIATVEREPDARMPGPAGVESRVGARTAEARVRLEGPDRVVVDVETAIPGMLVLLDPYDAGWKATSDRRSVPIVPVFGFFRGVYLDAGKREVVFSYAPSSMTCGVAVSAASALAALVIWIRPWGAARNRRCPARRTE